VITPPSLILQNVVENIESKKVYTVTAVMILEFLIFCCEVQYNVNN
jgi:hypothetical protein